MRATGTAAIRSRSPPTGSGPSARRAARRSFSRSSSGRTRTDRARPAIRYRRTRRSPSPGSAVQAAAQLFRGVRPHGQVPQAVRPPVAPPPPVAPTPADADGDGTARCAGLRATRQLRSGRGPPTSPTSRFVDSNCDGLDGTEKDAIFVSPLGKDDDPGTRQKPKRQIQAAVRRRGRQRRYVVAAAGSYAHVTTVSGIDLYGGYEQDSWARKASLVTAIAGSPEAMLAAGARGVTLQLLSVRGNHAEWRERVRHPCDREFGSTAPTRHRDRRRRGRWSPRKGGQAGASWRAGLAGRRATATRQCGPSAVPEATVRSAETVAREACGRPDQGPGRRSWSAAPRWARRVREAGQGRPRRCERGERCTGDAGRGGE